jgi:hypothetical protein
VGSSGTILSSTNGFKWTKRNSRTPQELYGITYANGSFVAVGQRGTILSSTDGVSWARLNSNIQELLGEIIYANGVFVALGWGGAIFSSSDAVVWNKRRDSGVLESLFSITYAQGMFVAVGDLGLILTSLDGETWTQRNSGTLTYFGGITYGNGLFVAVGSEGAIFTSSDGETWTIQNSGTTSYLSGVSYGNGVFVALGSEGTIITSPDGITWTQSNSGTTGFLSSITYGKGVFVAAGYNGVILNSPLIPVPIQDISGNYSGVLGDLGAMNPSTPSSSIVDDFKSVEGSINLTINQRGFFTARVKIGNNDFSGRGQLATDNREIDIDLQGRQDSRLKLNLSLVFDKNSRYFMGQVHSEEPMDALVGLQVFSRRNPLENAGQFTLALTLDPPGPVGLSGAGSGRIILSPTGSARVAAFLPDGTRFTLNTPVWGASGEPSDLILLVSHPLYRGNGAIGGWVHQIDTDSWTGVLDWTSPARLQGGTSLSPDGFFATLNADMLSYSGPRRGEKLFPNWSDNQGTLHVSSADLLADLQTSLTLLPNNRLTQSFPGESGILLRLAVQNPMGTFSGIVRLPNIAQPAPLKGVIDRNTGTGIGYFLTPSASGLIIIEPSMP